MKTAPNSETQVTEAPVVLTKEELTALDEGLRSEQSERIYTLDEALEFARQRRQAWMKKAAVSS